MCSSDLAGTILSAALLGESLNLCPSPQLGQFYMVPYKDNKRGVVNAQFQLGYKGYIQLAIRSGQYKRLNVLPIKSGELKAWDPLTEEITVEINDSENRDTLPTIGYYAMFEYINGFRKVLYWTKAKMLHHADAYSKAFSVEATNGKYPKVSFADYEAGNYDKNSEWLYSSFWYKNFDDMACKTMLRQLISRWGIMSTELQKAYESDMGVIGGDGSVSYVDNEPDSAGTMQEQAQTSEPQAVEPEQHPVYAAPQKSQNSTESVEDTFFGGAQG